MSCCFLLLPRERNEIWPPSPPVVGLAINIRSQLSSAENISENETDSSMKKAVKNQLSSIVTRSVTPGQAAPRSASSEFRGGESTIITGMERRAIEKRLFPTSRMLQSFECNHVPTKRSESFSVCHVVFLPLVFRGI